MYFKSTVLQDVVDESRGGNDLTNCVKGVNRCADVYSPQKRSLRKTKWG